VFPLDVNNPLVVLLAIVAVVLLFDLLLAGGGMTSSAVCGMAGAMSTPAGWLALPLLVALVWLAMGAEPFAGGAGTQRVGDVVLLLLGIVLVTGLGLVALVAWRDRDRTASQGPSSEEVLRTRYIRGELSREQYREVLVDILKDRYVRGEIDLEAYETALGRMLEEPRADRPGAAGAPQPPRVGRGAF